MLQCHRLSSIGFAIGNLQCLTTLNPRTRCQSESTPPTCLLFSSSLVGVGRESPTFLVDFEAAQLPNFRPVPNSAFRSIEATGNIVYSQRHLPSSFHKPLPFLERVSLNRAERLEDPFPETAPNSLELDAREGVHRGA